MGVRYSDIMIINKTNCISMEINDSDVEINQKEDVCLKSGICDSKTIM